MVDPSYHRFTLTDLYQGINPDRSWSNWGGFPDPEAFTLCSRRAHDLCADFQTNQVIFGRLAKHEEHEPPNNL